jgi:hypothetical protein
VVQLLAFEGISPAMGGAAAAALDEWLTKRSPDRTEEVHCAASYGSWKGAGVGAGLQAHAGSREAEQAGTMLFFTIALASRCSCLSAGDFFATPAAT